MREVVEYNPPHRHTSLFYYSKNELLDILVPYFKAGLRNNDFCIWIVSEPLGAEEAKSELSKTVENLDYYIKKGQIEIGDYKDYYLKCGVFTASAMLDYWAKKEKEVLEQGFNGIRVSGDCSWGLKEYWFNLSYYEEEINKTIDDHQMIALCTYHIDKLKIQQLLDIGTSHQSSLCKRIGRWDSIVSSDFNKAKGNP